MSPSPLPAPRASDAHREQRMRYLVDAAPVALILTDARGEIVEFNAHAELLFGRAREAVLGKGIEILIPQRLRAAHTAARERYSQAPENRAMGAGRALVGIRSDGREFPIEVGLSSLQTPEGSFVLAVAADVSAQRAAEDARRRDEQSLKASEARLRSVIDNMLAGLITFDVDGRIELVNHEAARIFGYEREELLSQPLSLVVPWMAEDQRLRPGSGGTLDRHTEWICRRKGGELFPCELALFEFATADGTRFAASIRDLSALRESDRVKREFVAMVSHELRTPLTSIRASIALLAAGAVGELPREVREMAAIAEGNANRLLRIVNDLLDLEAIENRSLDLLLAPVALACVLEEAAAKVTSFATRQGVALQFGATEAWVEADSGRLVQVLVGLVSNAVKFSPRGSGVTVAATTDADGVVVRVTDAGPGVPPSARERIFERFYQVDSSDSRQKGGIGLGLAIAKAIVIQHRGSIGLESDPGRGSTFWFRLPVIHGGACALPS